MLSPMPTCLRLHVGNQVGEGNSSAIGPCTVSPAMKLSLDAENFISVIPRPAEFASERAALALDVSPARGEDAATTASLYGAVGEVRRPESLTPAFRIMADGVMASGQPLHGCRNDD